MSRAASRLALHLALAAALGCRERTPAPQPVLATPTQAAAPARADTARLRSLRSIRPPYFYEEEAGPLVIPRVLGEACEGEWCSESYRGRSVACAPFELLAADSVGAPVAARVAVGDTLSVASFTLRIEEPGIVVFQRPSVFAQLSYVKLDSVRLLDSLHFAAGDTVYVLEYRQEGAFVWWYRGHFRTSSWFWTDDPRAPRETYPWMAARWLRPARTAQWLRFRTPSGAEGWRKEGDGPVRSVEGGGCG